MALTLDEINGMPTEDPAALQQALIAGGHIAAPAPPPEQPPLVPPATVATPLVRPDRYAGARNQNFSMPIRDTELGAAPEFGGTIGAAPAFSRPDRYAAARSQNFSFPANETEIGGTPELGGGAIGAAPGFNLRPGEPVNPARGTPLDLIGTRGTPLAPEVDAARIGAAPSFNIKPMEPVNPARGTPIAGRHVESPWDLSPTASSAPNLRTAAAPDVIAPEITAATGAAANLPATPLAALRAPTKQESIAAGKAEYLANRPQVTAAPGSSDFYRQKAAQFEYDKLHPYGADISAHPGTGGKILHTLGEIGQIAGQAVAPGIVASIPGTRLNRNIREAANLEQIGPAEQRETAAKTAESEAALRGAETAGRQATTAETVQKTAKEATEQNLITDAQGYVTGYKDAKGTVHSIDEPGTPQGIKDVAAATEAKTIKPSIEKMDNGDIVAVTPGRGGAPPTSQVVYHGDPKLETELSQRTVNGQEHKILINKKTGEDIRDLGAFKTEVSPATALAQMKAGEDVVLAYDKDNKAYLVPRADAKEEGLTHLTKAQPGDIEKSKTHHVVLNTLQTQLNSVVNSSKALDQNIVQRGIIAQALSHPTDSAVDSAIRATVMAGATQQTQDYVNSVRALREAGLALPKEITGGSRVSEVQASALWATMPGAASLNSKFALKQAKKFQQDIDRLRERAPVVRGMNIVDPDEAIASKGTEKQHPAGGGPAAAAAPAPPTGKVSVIDPQGVPHFVNADKVDKFLKDPNYKGWKRGS